MYSVVKKARQKYSQWQTNVEEQLLLIHKIAKPPKELKPFITADVV